MRRILHLVLFQAQGAIVGLVGIFGTILLIDRVGTDPWIVIPALLVFVALFVVAGLSSERLLQRLGERRRGGPEP